MTIKRYVEFRADGDINSVAGTVVSYADEARLGAGFYERFTPGSIRHSDVILNIMHDPAKPVARTGHGLTIDDNANALTIRSVIPDTVYGREARELIKAGILRGFSMEFRAETETFEGNTRIIKKAELSGVGLVDRPAYKQSTFERSAILPANLECRQNGISGDMTFGETAVTSQVHSRAIRIEPGALEQADDVFLLPGYDYNRSLASVAAGTLALTLTDTELRFNASRMPRTDALTDTRKRIRGKLLNGVIPGIRVLESRTEQARGFSVTIIEHGVLCEINLVSHSNPISSAPIARRRLL